MEKKKKGNQRGREEKPGRCSGLTPSSLLLRSPEALHRAPPPRTDPTPIPALGGRLACAEENKD